MPSDPYKVTYTVQRKNSFQQIRLDPRHTQAVHIYHVTDLCVCHTRGAGPDPPKWQTQDPTLTRELPPQLVEFLWCQGCSWKLLIIETRLRQSLLHRFQMSTLWALVFPNTWGYQIAGYPRMCSSCSTHHTLLLPPLGIAGIPLHYQTETNWCTEPCRG